MITGQYFRNFDAIRFMAAMLVLLHHTISESFIMLPSNGTFFGEVLLKLIDGGVGVSVFFVLSGFLITYLLITEYEKFGRIKLIFFYMRRILRIWPLYFLIVLIAFIIIPGLKFLTGDYYASGFNIIYQLFFISNFDMINVHQFCIERDIMSQGITWSVSIEEQFYLFWPLIFVILNKKFWITAIISIIGFSLVFRVFNSENYSFLYFHTFSVMMDLGIGGLLAILIKNYTGFKMFFVKMNDSMMLLIFLFVGLLVVFENYIFSFQYGQAVSRLFVSAGFGLIICAQGHINVNSKLNLFRFKFASNWGKYTYGIYLWHPIAIYTVNVLFKVIDFNRDNIYGILVYTLLSFVLTLIVSKLSYEYYERKFISMKSRFVNNPSGKIN